jgi:uncharacterized coiled-coil DUF342 family protein
MNPVYERLNEILGCTTITNTRYRELANLIEVLIRQRDEVHEELKVVRAERHDAREALRRMQEIVNNSRSVMGWHLNGDEATWDEFEAVEMIERALAAKAEPEERDGWEPLSRLEREDGA